MHRGSDHESQQVSRIGGTDRVVGNFHPFPLFPQKELSASEQNKILTGELLVMMMLLLLLLVPTMMLLEVMIMLLEVMSSTFLSTCCSVCQFSQYCRRHPKIQKNTSRQIPTNIFLLLEIFSSIQKSMKILLEIFVRPLKI